MGDPESMVRRAIQLNAGLLRDEHPKAWLPLVMLCADPSFSTTSAASELLVQHGLAERAYGGGLIVHDMIREVVLAMAGEEAP